MLLPRLDQENQGRRVVRNVTKRRRPSIVKWRFAHRKARSPRRGKRGAARRLLGINDDPRGEIEPEGISICWPITLSPARLV